MGKIHVYTGDGKGKTTAAFGMALRAAGHGKRVFIGQFLKHTPSGEVLACAALTGVETALFGAKRRVGDTLRREDEEAAQVGLQRSREAVLSGIYDLVILDEINLVLIRHLISTETVLQLIEACPKATELVFTGRYAPRRLVDAADLVTDMREVTHYAKTGLCAREGIEF